MRKDGLRVSLVEDALLDGSGILQSKEGTAAAYGFSAGAIQLFLQIVAAGGGGLAIKKVAKELKNNFNEYLTELEIQSLVNRVNNARGEFTHLNLTWKGQEALEAAKIKPAAKSWASQRRAELG